MQSLRFSEILPVVVDSSFKSKFGQRLGNEKCTKNTEDRNKCSALIVTESRQEKNDSRSGKTEKESANIGNEENVIEMEKKGAWEESEQVKSWKRKWNIESEIKNKKIMAEARR